MAIHKVCVVIAARNAASTIETAIRSALREPEVAEVVVVDDGSVDETSSKVLNLKASDDRVTLIKLTKSHGPAYARNRAIEHSSAPFIAVLDADDCFAPGRFSRLFVQKNWDFIADNILFVKESPCMDLLNLVPPSLPASPNMLSFETFVAGNISRSGYLRGELGFLKPVFRKAFLTKHNLRYHEALRLGEDYALYAEALALGARYKYLKSCGYFAIVHDTSLSSCHRTADLKALADQDLRLLSAFDTKLHPDQMKWLKKHEKHVRGKYRHRCFLDLKASNGIGPALRYMFHSADIFVPIFMGVLRDKVRGMKDTEEAGKTGNASQWLLMQSTRLDHDERKDTQFH